MLTNCSNFGNDLLSNPYKIESRRCGRHDLRDRERPPNKIDVVKRSKDESRRDEGDELSHDRYDHAVEALAERLEKSTRNDTVCCDREREAYDPEGGGSHGHHCFRGIEK